MTSPSGNDLNHDEPVVVPYSLLQSPDSTLAHLLERAFSSSATSLGLLIVSDLPPEFSELRRRLLLLSNAFASLPEHRREAYADEASSYTFGWSCGKERMNGKLDSAKGSFYANPQWDRTPPTREGGPEGVNLWPKNEDGVDGFEEAFKGLCKVMVEVGGLVARACQGVVGADEGGKKLANSKTVEELVMSSKANKARLLHYVSPHVQNSTTFP